MANVAVTCIKNGRSDSFGRPLVSGTYYPSVEIETAKALWNSGYVSVADASVFDQDPLAGTSPLDDFNVARSLALTRRPEQSRAIISAELAAVGAPSPAYSIGIPGTQGFGVGICDQPLPSYIVGLPGYNTVGHDNYGNYQTIDGSIIVWIPAFYYKWGTGSNGLAINTISLIGARSFSSHEVALSQGYALHRMFYDGGFIKSGVFCDKYRCSRSADGIAVSVKNGAPLSSHSAHNPFSSLNGSPPNTHAGALDAAKTRGSRFFANSRFIRAGLAMIARAHAQESINTTYCDWYDATNNFPKGCNNNALGDTQDAGVLYVSDGYSYSALTGSGSPFANTTHNGQACGVADLNGGMWEVTLGLTSDGTSFYTIKRSVEMASLTGGNTLATDAWGAAGLAANYTNIGATYGALLASGTTKLFGNAAQVFDSAQSGVAWEMACLGIPLVGGTGGTNAFGNDALYDYRPNDMCALSGGTWYGGSPAGVWTLNLSAARSNSGDNVGFRAALYL